MLYVCVWVSNTQCRLMSLVFFCVFFFKHKTAYEMRISDWSSDLCSSDLNPLHRRLYRFLRTGPRALRASAGDDGGHRIYGSASESALNRRSADPGAARSRRLRPCADQPDLFRSLPHFSAVD